MIFSRKKNKTNKFELYPFITNQEDTLKSEVVYQIIKSNDDEIICEIANKKTSIKIGKLDINEGKMKSISDWMGLFVIFVIFPIYCKYVSTLIILFKLNNGIWQVLTSLGISITIFFLVLYFINKFSIWFLRSV